MRSSPHRRLPALAISALSLVTGLVGCGGYAAKEDPATRLKDERIDIPTRVSLVDELWGQSTKDQMARESVKRVAWQTGYPGPIRKRAIDVLASDPADVDQADTRAMLRLMLPIEPDSFVAQSICERVRDGRWTEFAPALVRRYARRTELPDEERPERAALLAIFPAQPLEQTAYDVFAAPASGASPEALERSQKARLAAWELLARLDKDGSRRAAMLAGEAGPATDPLLGNLRSAANDLGAVPLTASQLDWVGRLRDFASSTSGAANRAWWEQARAAVAALPADRRQGWALRHVEPLRWAAAHRPELIALDRDSLASELRPKFKGRRTHARGADRGPGELLGESIDRLAWGDLLTIAIIDEAVRAPGFGTELAKQVERDRRDASTEYGGVLEWREGPEAGGGRFVATLYPPRASQRQGDMKFVASDDMLNAGGAVLAHYHFHVQRVENSDYAGPGPGDLDYANDQGRACVVFTSVREDAVDADYYQSGGTVVDLGEVLLK